MRAARRRNTLDDGKPQATPHDRPATNQNGWRGGSVRGSRETERVPEETQRAKGQEPLYRDHNKENMWTQRGANPCKHQAHTHESRKRHRKSGKTEWAANGSEHGSIGR